MVRVILRQRKNSLKDYDAKRKIRGWSSGNLTVAGTKS